MNKLRILTLAFVLTLSIGTFYAYSIPTVNIGTSISNNFPENCVFINEWQTDDSLYINYSATEVVECGN